jgi:hypothetical protein
VTLTGGGLRMRRLSTQMALVIGLGGAVSSNLAAQPAAWANGPRAAALAMSHLGWARAPGADLVRLPDSTLVARVGVPLGTVPPRRRHHALLGGIVGGLAGAAAGFWLGSQASTSCEANCGGLSFAAGAVGSVVGAGAGALIGWAVPKR